MRSFYKAIRLRENRFCGSKQQFRVFEPNEKPIKLMAALPRPPPKQLKRKSDVFRSGAPLRNSKFLGPLYFRESG